MPPRRIRRPWRSTSLNAPVPLRRRNRPRRPVESGKEDPGDTEGAVLGAVVIRESSLSRSVCRPLPGYTQGMCGLSGSPGRPLAWRSVTCSGGEPPATLLAPSTQDGAALARSDTMPEPVLALSAAIVRLVSALHSGSLIGQPGNGARCGETACPVRAGSCRHFLEVSQEYGHPARFAKMLRLRRLPVATGASRTASCSPRTRNNPTRTAKTPRATTSRSDMHPLTWLTWCYAAAPPRSHAFPGWISTRAARDAAT